MKMQGLIQMMLVLSVAMVGIIGAAPEARAADALSVEVRTIAASRTGDRVDPALSDIQSTLNVTFAGYTSFSQLAVNRVSLSEGGTRQIELPNRTQMSLTFNGYAGKLVKLGLVIAGKMSTTLRVSSGSTFFQAGMKHGDGILILAIKVD